MVKFTPASKVVRHEDDLHEKLRRMEVILSKILERLDAIEEEIKSLKTKEDEKGRAQRKTRKYVVEGRSRKRTALDIMEEQGVVFESDLRLSNRDKFFEYLKRNGVIVLEGSKERVGVTKEFLERFLRELEEYDPGDVEEKMKDKKMRRLYAFLRESGYLTYGRGTWNLNINT